MAEAAEQLEAAASLVPPNRQLMLLLADCDIRLGRYKKVIDQLSPLEKEYVSDPAFNYALGTALVQDGQAERGAVLIDRILRDGDSAEAQLLLGATKIFAQDYTGALRDLERAVRLNPRLPEVHAYYGQALLRTGDAVGAAAAFRKELEGNPTDFLANLELGVFSKQDQKFKESREFLGRALRSRPGDPGVRYQMATVDMAEGKVEDARVKLESLVKESPQFIEAHVSLATVYYRLKRKEDGDKERAIAQKLTADEQAKQAGVHSK
jgi:Flp pilus assembly protein TadD